MSAKVQQFVYAIEEGGWVPFMRLMLILALVASVASLFLFFDFRGLAHSKGMEQAQIARELARGNGFSTKLIRPAALSQFEQNKKSLPGDLIPDTYHAPLHPLINAPFLWLAKSKWSMTSKDITYVGDRIISAVSLLFFILGTVVNYFVVRRLFDARVAALSAGMSLLCLKLWSFTTSGLPQMLMFFLFGLCTYCLLRAVEARNLSASPTLWLLLSSVGFGLLALAHSLTIWIFAGTLLFTLLYFPKRLMHAGLSVLVLVLLYSPWLLRNQKVCGSPFGVAPYSAFYQLRGTETEIMRAMPFKPGTLSPLHFRSKIQNQVLTHFANIYSNLGSVFLAPVFFVALLHLFKSPIASAFRWCVLMLWLFALFGMSVFGFSDGEQLQSNDLHVLFIPLFAAYGTAFVLSLWNRLELLPFLRIAFIGFLLVVSAAPLINQLTAPDSGPVQWPPYVPPYIAILGEWTEPSETIMSDMPWAVAWYADRKSLWLPLNITDYFALNDYKLLNSNIVGMYLTPITGNSPFISSIIKGEWKDWAPFIKREANTADFPMKAVTALPIGNECVFYADRDRWSKKAN